MTEPTIMRQEVKNMEGADLLIVFLKTRSRALSAPRQRDYTNPYQESEDSSLKRDRQEIAVAKANLPLFETEINRRLAPLDTEGGHKV